MRRACSSTESASAVTRAVLRYARADMRLTLKQVSHRRHNYRAPEHLGYEVIKFTVFMPDVKLFMEMYACPVSSGKLYCKLHFAKRTSGAKREKAFGLHMVTIFITVTASSASSSQYLIPDMHVCLSLFRKTTAQDSRTTPGRRTPAEAAPSAHGRLQVPWARCSGRA